MKKQIFAILDLELTYACNLMEIFSDRRSIPFETLIFSNLESIGEYTKKHTIDLLLVSARMMCEELRRMNIRKIMILSEGEILKEYEEYPSVYKYQASDHLVAEVMNYYASQADSQMSFFRRKQVKLIGVYSPVGRCGKTAFALTLGQMLAKHQPVLYLNLEDYSGFAGLLGQESASDLSDVMYFVRQNKGSIAVKIHAAVQKLGNMDYISPAFSAGDLREIPSTDWVRFLEELENGSTYSTVLLDFGSGMQELFYMLSMCSRIYTPVCSDGAAKAKLEQYESLLKEMEYEDILEKTKKLTLPFARLHGSGEYMLEQLVQGEMGRFVRKLLAEEAGEYEAGTGGVQTLT